jgi:hypothetical protein
VHRDFLLLLYICYKLKRTPYIISKRLVIQEIRYALKILSWETPWGKRDTLKAQAQIAA